jgi:acetyl esterase
MLNPQAKKLLDLGKVSGLLPVYILSVNDARKRMRDAFISNDDKECIYNIENTFISCPDYRIGLRIYRPSDKKNLPCIVFFHGGGWTLNDLDTHDGLCRSLSNNVDAVVVSVDYRRSPEYKFPAPIEDAYIATEWTFANADRLCIDSNKIAVGGDSSGGTQAAVVCMLARDRNTFKIKFQWLVYPVTDYYLPGTQSYQEMSIGYSMNRDFMIWFWNNYLPSEVNLNNPYLCPLRSNNFINLPPAFIMTANYDPLRDEAELYAEKLKSANVKVKLTRYKDQMHGFLMQRKNIDAANEAFKDAVNELKNGFF